MVDEIEDYGLKFFNFVESPSCGFWAFWVSLLSLSDYLLSDTTVAPRIFEIIIAHLV